MKTCTEVLTFGDLGPTVEDETPTEVCGRPAEWVIERPGVRPRYRCERHVEQFRQLTETFPDMTIRQAAKP